MRTSLLMLATLTGCSMKSFVTPTATIGAATLGAVAGGPGGAALAGGVGYAAAELWTLDDENKQLVTAITTGDVKGIVAAQMKGQQSTIEKATDTIWTALKVAALCILGVLSIPLFITRSNTKKINKICEKNDKAT
tara:strand:- start:815 stop:1222 length:408 start_codon:yes stop_codon:yes gene_type:complete